MAGDLQLALLGKLEIRQDGFPVVGLTSAKAQALLCYLAVTGRPHFRTSLAGLLWGDMPDTNARTNLRRELSALRRTVGEHLTITRQEVAFSDDAPYWLDVEAFQTATDQGTIEGLREAVELYRGDFLEGFYVRDAPAFEEWVLVQGTRLRELALQALHTLSVHYAEQGESGLKEGIKYTSRLLALEPSREEAHRGLMLLLAQTGQRGAALAQYDACRQALAEDLGVEPGPETRELYERIRDGELRRIASAPPLVEVEATVEIPHNLPTQPTPFIGRETELADLDALLAGPAERDASGPAVRLITIVGPGGIGKTRLAMACAERQLRAAGQTDAIADGVFFVALASLSAPEQMVPALAQAFQFQSGEGGDRTPKMQLLDFLRAKCILLVLDNVEHLLCPPALRASPPAGGIEGGAAELVAEILRAASDVHILVTSRERLNLQQEQVYPLQGLAFPDGATAVSEATSYAAVKLFLQSARRVLPDFELAAKDLADLTRICALVEGMPLGIELAASWVDVLSLGDIAQEIQRGLDFLATDWQDAPERHRSVRAAFDATWRRLTETDQAVFAQLCVFRGGFTRESAREVVGANLRTLARLVDKSLLQFNRSQERYDLHELLRQYGCEQLAADPEQEHDFRDRHSAYFCDALGRWGDAWNRGIRFEPEFDVEVDWPNLQAAWGRAADETDVDRLDLALEGMRPLIIARMVPWREAERLFQHVIERLSEKPQSHNADSKRVLAKALLFRCDCNHYTRKLELARSGIRQSKALLADPALSASDTRAERSQLHVVLAQQSVPDWEEVRWHFQEALALDQDLDHLGMVAFRMLNIAWTYAEQGNYDQVVPRGEDALRIFVSSGNQIGELRAHFWLSQYAVTARNLRELERCSRALYTRAADYGNTVYQAAGLELQGMAAVMLGRYAQAEQRLKECRQMAQQAGAQDQHCRVVQWLGATTWFRGDVDTAESFWTESLGLARRAGLSGQAAVAQHWLSYTACARGDFDRAEALCEAGLAALGEHDLALRAMLKLALARIALFRGDPTQAVEQFQGCLQVLRPTGSWRNTISALEGLSWTMAALERYEETAQLLGFLATDRELAGLVLPPVDRPHHDGALNLAQEGLREEAFAAAWEAGAALTLEQAVELALAISA